MRGPDQFETDEQLMDELDGAMDELDSKKFMPVVQVTVAVNKDGESKPESEAEDSALPTPEEMEELEKALG